MKKILVFVDALLFGLILCGLLFSLKYAASIDQLIISLK